MSMPITQPLIDHLVKNHNAPSNEDADIDDCVYRKKTAALLLSGEMSAEKLEELIGGEEMTIAPEKVFNRSSGNGSRIRVKDPSESYDETRYEVKHAKTGQPADTRIRRMVMLGPPNHGSDVANTLSDNPLFKAGGKAGQELGAGWNVLSQKLVTPPFEFSVIAGGRRDDKGFNPFLRGDDDGIVRVESAKLDGESDFTVVPVLHSFLMDNPRVQERALWFLTRKQRHRAVRP